jgi:hypothetical protein
MTSEDLSGPDLSGPDLSGPELPRRPVRALPQAAAPDSAAQVAPALAGEPQPPVSGDEDVDALIAQLVAHAAVPLEEQLPILEAVHRTLQDRLADVEG